MNLSVGVGGAMIGDSAPRLVREGGAAGGGGLHLDGDALPRGPRGRQLVYFKNVYVQPPRHANARMHLPIHLLTPHPLTHPGAKYTPEYAQAHTKASAGFLTIGLNDEILGFREEMSNKSMILRV